MKIGYPADSGSHPEDREHLWFEVHGVTDNGIDAMLLNEPFDPRTLEVARQLREARPRILEALEEMRGVE